MTAAPTLLLADIGGTNTRVAVSWGRQVDPASVRRYKNADYQAQQKDIADILRDYRSQTGARVDGVCVAAAGPVQDGVATLTNLRWTMDTHKLSAATGARHVEILNDLQAQGHALGHIPAENLRTVIDGPKHDKAPMLVVGLGTGVNAAPVHGSGIHRIVPPSECGHVNMPVRTEEDFRLMRFVENLLRERGETPHCGAEEVLAGRGLGNLFAFAAHAADRADRLASADVLAADATGDAAAAHAIQLYTHILAQALADLALIHLPYGGIYLIGGMSRAMAPHFGRFDITKAFRELRRVTLLTTEFSVTVVEDDNAALVGCAAFLTEKMLG